MLTIKFVQGKAVGVAPLSEAAAFWKNLPSGETLDSLSTGYQNRNDWTMFGTVSRIAVELTHATKKLYVPIDHGEGVSPRFDVIEAPKVGDEVSKAFNGDYYPCGAIKSVSPSLRVITTTTGLRFYRQGKSARWVNHQTWALIPGHIDERNPSF